MWKETTGDQVVAGQRETDEWQSMYFEASLGKRETVETSTGEIQGVAWKKS